MELDSTFLLACLIVLVATIIAGLAGFGMSIVSIPPLLLIYDPGSVIALTKILTLGTTWIVAVQAWRHISWQRIAKFLPPALVGLFIGSWLLRVLDPEVIKVIVGAVVFSLAMLLLTWQPQAVPERGWMSPLVGLLSGVGSTATGMAGPPLVLFLTLIMVARETFRATTATYFIIVDSIGLPTLVAQGAVTMNDLRLALALAPVAVVGRVLGILLVPHVSPPAFRRATLVLLLITGMVSIADGLPGLL